MSAGPIKTFFCNFSLQRPLQKKKPRAKNVTQPTYHFYWLFFLSRIKMRNSWTRWTLKFSQIRFSPYLKDNFLSSPFFLSFLGFVCDEEIKWIFLLSSCETSCSWWKRYLKLNTSPSVCAYPELYLICHFGHVLCNIHWNMS